MRGGIIFSTSEPDEARAACRLKAQFLSAMLEENFEEVSETCAAARPHQLRLADAIGRLKSGA
jgi:hypothetical protein